MATPDINQLRKLVEKILENNPNDPKIINLKEKFNQASTQNVLQNWQTFLAVLDRFSTNSKETNQHLELLKNAITKRVNSNDLKGLSDAINVNPGTAPKPKLESQQPEQSPPRLNEEQPKHVQPGVFMQFRDRSERSGGTPIRREIETKEFNEERRDTPSPGEDRKLEDDKKFKPQ